VPGSAKLKLRLRVKHERARGTNCALRWSQYTGMWIWHREAGPLCRFRLNHEHDADRAPRTWVCIFGI
jgi:hypothetical protein